MNDDFATLYAYNQWADGLVLDACRRLTAEQYVAEPVPGWSSVRSSIHHIAIVTAGWLRTVAGEQVGSVPDEADLPTVDDAARVLDRAYQIITDFLPTLTAEQLAKPRTFQGRGRVAILPPWVVLRHVVNHQTTVARLRPSSSGSVSNRRQRARLSGHSLKVRSRHERSRSTTLESNAVAAPES